MQTMNANKKTIEVSTSSLIDLKAELFRKQEEFKKQKLQNLNQNFIATKSLEKSAKKPGLWSKQNTGVQERAKKDKESVIGEEEEEETFNKSRAALIAKTKIYEDMTREGFIPDDDEEEESSYLVDFQRKALKKIDEKRKETKEQLNKEKEEVHIPVPIPASAEEEWVEYVDSLGRSRCCLKKDLAGFIKMDQELHPQRSNDITKEDEKKKWEKEEETPEKPVGPIHYQNVQFKEIRDHGVGYFSFSEQESTRQKQLDLLNSLRDQTVEQRQQREDLKLKRKNILKERLAKIKQRKKLKAGLPLSESEEENEKSDGEDSRVAEQPAEENHIEIDEKEEKRKSHIRPWDKGKVMTQRNWIMKSREERPAEFAPPENYFGSASSIKQNKTFNRKKLWNPEMRTDSSNIYSETSSTQTLTSNKNEEYISHLTQEDFNSSEIDPVSSPLFSSSSNSLLEPNVEQQMSVEQSIAEALLYFRNKNSNV